MRRTKISRRTFLQVSGIGVTSAVLAACAAPVAPSGGEEGAVAQASVELRWWVNPFTQDDIEQVWTPLTERFYEEGHEGIQIDTEIMPWSDRRQKMMTAYAGGRAADVSCMNVDMIWSFGGAGALAPLDDYLADEIVSDTPQGLTDLCYLEGKLYMVPYNTGPFGRLYNPDLLESVGWDMSRFPDSWDDLRELGAMSADNGLFSTLLRVDGATWYYMLWQNDGRVLQEDESGTVTGSALDSEQTRETWMLYKEHFDNNWSPIEFVTMQVSAQMPNYFLSKDMIISQRHSAQGASDTVSQAEDINIAVLPQPFSKVRPVTNSSDGSVAMYSTCKDFAAGGEWLSFVMSADVLAEWSNLGGYIPSRESARAADAWPPGDLVRSFGELTPYVEANKDRYFYFRPGYQTVNPELHAYILGNKSLEDALMAAHTALDTLIQEDLTQQGG
ncbi:extracellular solute-binding protein [Chloroflexi bacterium TSY]|nr:extracellular solute-binding protein [Chloroflexi bacterium TSY]